MVREHVCSRIMVREHVLAHAARASSRGMTPALQTCSLGHPRKKVKNIFSHTIFSRLSKAGECIVFAVFHAKIFTKVTANEVKYSCSVRIVAILTNLFCFYLFTFK